MASRNVIKPPKGIPLSPRPQPRLEFLRGITVLHPASHHSAGCVFLREVKEELEPPLFSPGPVEVRPKGELAIGPRECMPAMQMHHIKSAREACAVLTSRTFQQKGPRQGIERVEQIDQHRRSRQLARIEFRIAVHDSMPGAFARFISPPEVIGIRPPQIQDCANAVRAQERSKKPRIGLCRARRVARLDPMEVVGNVQYHRTSLPEPVLPREGARARVAQAGRCGNPTG